MKYKTAAIEEKEIIARQSKSFHSETKPKLIVCYYAHWKHKSIDGNPCTHIIYAFIEVLANGTIKEIDDQKGKNSTSSYKNISK